MSSSSNNANSLVTEWDNEYARLARVASQLRTTGIVTSKDTVRSLQLGLQRLEASLSSMSSMMIPPHEIQRRRRLVQHLQQTTTSSGMMPPSSNDEMNSNDAFGQPQQHAPPQSKMALAMRQQDEMIDQLAVGVGRLKTQTAIIGEEATMQVNLMTDMDTNLDAATYSLQDQTRRAATLREEQSLWKLQLIVAGLAILLVLEIFLGLTP